MKKIFFVFIVWLTSFMFFNHTLLAEVEIGVKGGIGSFNLSASNFQLYSFQFGAEEYRPGLKSLTSFQVGAFVSFDILKNFAFQPEVYYVMRGARAGEFFAVIGKEFKAKIKIDYIEIPLLLKYKPPLGNRVKPILFAGPYIGFRLNAYHTVGLIELEIEGDYKEQVKNQYLGLIIGGGFEYNLKSMKLILEGRYSFGVTSILAPEFVQPDQSLIPRSFVLMLGISI